MGYDHSLEGGGGAMMGEGALWSVCLCALSC